MKENLIHARTSVYNINYHVVWSVKYRRKIITRQIEEELQQLVQNIAVDKGFTVHLFESGEMDHIHCFVSAPPKLSVSYIVKMLKGITGRKLFEMHPEIHQKLWRENYGITVIMWKQLDWSLRRISGSILRSRQSPIKGDRPYAVVKKRSAISNERTVCDSEPYGLCCL